MQLLLDTAEEICDTPKGTCPPQAACLSIRYADYADLQTVLEMYMTALAEIKDHVCEPNPDKCLRTVLFSWAQAPCILLEKTGEIIGFAGLKTVVPEYSDEAVLREYMWYVKPKHRSYKALKMISDACQAVSDKFKIPLYMAHMVFDMDIPLKDKVLKRWGYNTQTIEVSYGR